MVLTNLEYRSNLFDKIIYSKLMLLLCLNLILPQMKVSLKDQVMVSPFNVTQQSIDMTK